MTAKRLGTTKATIAQTEGRGRRARLLGKGKAVSVAEKVTAGKQTKVQLRKVTIEGLEGKRIVFVISAKVLPNEILVVDEHGKKRGHYRFSAIPAPQSADIKEVSGVNPVGSVSVAPHGGLPPVDPKRRAKTMAAAEARGAIIADNIMTRRDMLSGGELAAELRLTRQAIDKRRRAGRILAITTSKRGCKYPKAQFGPTGEVLPGIEKVVGHFKQNGWRAWRFLSQAHTALGNKTGFTALKDGKIRDVLKLLTAIDHGAFS